MEGDSGIPGVRRKASTRSGPNRPPVLDQGIQWLWQTPADQVEAKRRVVWDHVPSSIVRCGRCSTFLVDSPSGVFCVNCELRGWVGIASATDGSMMDACQSSTGSWLAMIVEGSWLRLSTISRMSRLSEGPSGAVPSRPRLVSVSSMA